MERAFVFLPVSPEDAREIVDTVSAGFEGYRAFAPPGWNPPPDIGSVEGTRRRLGDDDVFGLLARTPEGDPAGHVTVSASTRSRWAGGSDDLAHVWQLFVREPYWGSGLAVTLHGQAVEQAMRRGYASMRLYTPERQARARRFYEREGWRLRGEPILSSMGMPVVEYRRPLPTAAS